MERAISNSRRDFLRVCACGTAGTALLAGLEGCASTDFPRKKHISFSLGMASYTFREFNRDEAFDMTHRLGLPRIALKDVHLPLNSSPPELRAASHAAEAKGLTLYGCGVVYMTTPSEVENAFSYAKNAGIQVLIGVPEHDLLPLVQEKVRETGIKLAIHNHGPGDERYPTPHSVYEKIRDRDSRIGLCIDVGHTRRIGEDPAESIIAFSDRVFDIHIKDVSAATAQGETIEAGRGVVDIPAVLKALLKIHYSGTVAFEFEKDSKDPLPGVAESVGFVRGLLEMLA